MPALPRRRLWTAWLGLAPEERRATLLAQPLEGEPGAWAIEIRLQGDAETVFFDV